MLGMIPWESLLGGMLLGVSATLLLLFNGKIAGISGILTGLLSSEKGDYVWRWLFVIGMIAGGALSVKLFDIPLPDMSNTSLIGYITAGALVGVGTRLGNGCTSGHGICGIGRLSKRSIVATCVFMFVAALTVYVRQHII